MYVYCSWQMQDKLETSLNAYCISFKILSQILESNQNVPKTFLKGFWSVVKTEIKTSSKKQDDSPCNCYGFVFIREVWDFWRFISVCQYELLNKIVFHIFFVWLTKSVLMKWIFLRTRRKCYSAGRSFLFFLKLYYMKHFAI